MFSIRGDDLDRNTLRLAQNEPLELHLSFVEVLDIGQHVVLSIAASTRDEKQCKE